MNKNYKKLRKVLKRYKNNRFDVESLWKIIAIVMNNNDLDVIMTMIKFYQDQPQELKKVFESKKLW